MRPGYQVSFRGFLISVFDKATNLPVGRMRQTTQFVMASIPSNITTKLVCDNTSLTHWTADDKKIIFFEWEAPWTFTEDNDLEIRWEWVVIVLNPLPWKLFWKCFMNGTVACYEQTLLSTRYSHLSYEISPAWFMIIILGFICSAFGFH